MEKKALGLWVMSLLVVLAPLSVAQDSPPRNGGNPYQEEFEYQLGEQLTINVNIGGLVWRRFAMNVDEEAELVGGEETRAEITLEAENPTDDALTLETILLFEDERGNTLERIELKSFKVKGGRLDEDVQKMKIDGGVLVELAKIYFFVEVS